MTLHTTLGQSRLKKATNTVNTLQKHSTTTTTTTTTQRTETKLGDNRPFPNNLSLLSQSESHCKAFHLSHVNEPKFASEKVISI